MWLECGGVRKQEDVKGEAFGVDPEVGSVMQLGRTFGSGIPPANTIYFFFFNIGR